MTKQEQDRNWKLLSEESKCFYRTEWENRLEDAKREIEDLEKGGYDLTISTSKAIADDLERMFGKHNLQSSLTYKDVARELFGYGNEKQKGTFCCPIFSENHCDKISAINALLCTAKFLNKNEDGSDWVPDFDNEKELKWHPLIRTDKEIGLDYTIKTKRSFVYFRTEELLQQALQILGEDVVRTALTTKY